MKVPKSEAPTKDPFLAIRDVENALGLGVNGAEHLDNIPRAADYREAFKPVARKALELLNTITEWSDYYSDQFTYRGKDVHEIEQALTTLFEVSTDVVRQAKGKSSKGARKQTALMEVVRRLRRIFRDYYQGTRAKRKKQGAFESLASWEKHELAFVEMALLAARLVRKGHYDLRRLFLDPRCSLIEERGDVIERIARKGHAEQKRNIR